MKFNCLILVMELNDKQKRFCEEYVIDLNATQAAIRAGYSKKTAAVIATENLTKPNIQEFISNLQKSISDKNGNLTQKVIDELIKVGFSNVQDYIISGNCITDISEIDGAKAAAVASIKKSVTTFGTEENGGTKEVVEFKLWDKISALEKLGRHLGIFEADNKQKPPPISVEKPYSRNELIELIKQANGATPTN